MDDAPPVPPSPWTDAISRAIGKGVSIVKDASPSEHGDYLWEKAQTLGNAAAAGIKAVKDELLTVRAQPSNESKVATTTVFITNRQSDRKEGYNKLLSVPWKILQSLGSGLGSLCGLSPGDLSFPASTPDRFMPLDLVVRACGFGCKVIRVCFYPEIFFRSLVIALTLRATFVGVSHMIRALKRRQFSRTKVGAGIYDHRLKMKEATSYTEYRAAERQYLIAAGTRAAARPLNEGEQALIAKLDRRFKRYRDYIRNKDQRRLQFELRSDLLRKHFASETRHPKVRDALQRYSGIVCCAFALIASGSVPGPLLPLVELSRTDLDKDQSAGVGLNIVDQLESFHASQAAEQTKRAQESEPFSPPTAGSTTSSVRRRGSIFGLIQVPDDEHQKIEAVQAWQGGDDGHDKQPEDDEFEYLDTFAGDGRKSQLEQLRARLKFFQETRHSFGRTALLFSGGARMGLYHIGVMKTLMDHNLLPRVISGSSAGSIVVAVLGCRTPDEIRAQVFDPHRMNTKFFGRSDGLDEALQLMLHGRPLPQEMQASLLGAVGAEKSAGGGLLLAMLTLVLPLLAEPYPSYIPLLKALLPKWNETKALLDIQVLGRAIKDLVGDMTFQEAYEKTGRTINITATPFGGDRDVPLLLNYLSSPYVTVSSACMASCCIPGIFSPVKLVSKTIDGMFEEYNPSGLSWIDGSLESDLPMPRLSELFNVNHFIVSQVEPHARFFAPADAYELEDLPLANQYMLGHLGSAVKFAREQGRSYLEQLSQVAFMRFFLTTSLGKALVPAMIQRYDGDITLYPRAYTRDLYTLLQNPTPQQYLDAIMEGERMTWQKLRKIRRLCQCEMMMDDCCFALDLRIRQLENTAGSSTDLIGSTASQAIKRKQSYFLQQQQNRQAEKKQAPQLQHMLLGRIKSETGLDQDSSDTAPSAPPPPL